MFLSDILPIEWVLVKSTWEIIWNWCKNKIYQNWIGYTLMDDVIRRSTIGYSIYFFRIVKQKHQVRSFIKTFFLNYNINKVNSEWHNKRSKNHNITFMLFLCYIYSFFFDMIVPVPYTSLQHNDTCFDWFLYSDSSHMFFSMFCNSVKKKTNQFAFDFVLWFIYY